MKPRYDLIHNKVEFHRNIELDTLFQQTGTSITDGVILTLLLTN